MLTISIRQPWSSMILAGEKVVENRTWPTKYRGPLLIHAGGRAEPRYSFEDTDVPYDAPRGCVLGQVELLDCIHASDLRLRQRGILAKEVYDACHSLHAGCDWLWVLSKPRWLTKPVPLKARLRLFDVPLAKLGEFVTK